MLAREGNSDTAAVDVGFCVALKAGAVDAVAADAPTASPSLLVLPPPPAAEAF